MHSLSRQLALSFCAVFLLGAQQVGYAHLIGHLGLSGRTTAQPADVAGDAVALRLSHVCTTCIAISAMAGCGPLAMSSAPAEATGGADSITPFPRCLATAGWSPHTARAPPAL